MSIALSKCPVK